MIALPVNIDEQLSERAQQRRRRRSAVDAAVTPAAGLDFPARMSLPHGASIPCSSASPVRQGIRPGRPAEIGHRRTAVFVPERTRSADMRPPGTAPTVHR